MNEIIDMLMETQVFCTIMSGLALLIIVLMLLGNFISYIAREKRLEEISLFNWADTYDMITAVLRMHITYGNMFSIEEFIFPIILLCIFGCGALGLYSF